MASSWRNFSRNLGADPAPSEAPPSTNRPRNLADLAKQYNAPRSAPAPAESSPRSGGSGQSRPTWNDVQPAEKAVYLQGWGMDPTKAREVTGATPESPAFGTGTKGYARYTTRQLSQEEWEALSGSQQNAVTANQLLYEASKNPARSGEIYDYLGVDEKQREEVSSYATLDDIKNFNKTGASDRFSKDQQPLGLMQNTESAFRNLRNLSAKVGEVNALPNDLALLLGRGTTPTEGHNLDNLEPGFQNMILSYLEGGAPSSQDIDLFNKEFSAAIEGMPLEEVKSRFKKTAAAAKETNGSIDIEALANFYNLGD